MGLTRRTTVFRGGISIQRGPYVASRSNPRTSRPRRLISLGHLGGIRAFIERCSRIDSISDEMCEIVEARWPDLAIKLPRKSGA